MPVGSNGICMGCLCSSLRKEATLRVSLKTIEAESTGERKLLLNRNKFVHAEPSREKSCCRSKRLEMEIQ